MILLPFFNAITTLQLTSLQKRECSVFFCVLQWIIEKAGGIGKIGYMGIGAPNGNIISGSVEYAPNISWAHDTKVSLAKMFSERLGGLPVTLTNDANAAAIGEKTFGVAKGMKDFIVLTLGTGVGSGVVCNGELVYGYDGNAGELGHLRVKEAFNQGYPIFI